MGPPPPARRAKSRSWGRPVPPPKVCGVKPRARCLTTAVALSIVPKGTKHPNCKECAKTHIKHNNAVISMDYAVMYAYSWIQTVRQSGPSVRRSPKIRTVVSPPRKGRQDAGPTRTRSTTTVNGHRVNLQHKAQTRSTSSRHFSDSVASTRFRFARISTICFVSLAEP